MEHAVQGAPSLARDNLVKKLGNYFLVPNERISLRAFYDNL